MLMKVLRLLAATETRCREKRKQRPHERKWRLSLECGTLLAVGDRRTNHCTVQRNGGKMLRVQAAMCVPLGTFDAVAKEKHTRDAMLRHFKQWAPRFCGALIDAPGPKGF